jgi:hypothetical protein
MDYAIRPTDFEEILLAGFVIREAPVESIERQLGEYRLGSASLNFLVHNGAMIARIGLAVNSNILPKYFIGGEVAATGVAVFAEVVDI